MDEASAHHARQRYVIYTIGHSNLALGDFIRKLKEHAIDAVADVRSNPFSQYVAHFSSDNIKRELISEGIHYVYLGKELGIRKKKLVAGKPIYDQLIKDKLFQQGISRLFKGMQKGYRIALMCAEKDPVKCHRAILIGRYLKHERDVEVLHILQPDRLNKSDKSLFGEFSELGEHINMSRTFPKKANNEVETHNELEKRLALLLNIKRNHEEFIGNIYREYEKAIYKPQASSETCQFELDVNPSDNEER